MISQTAVEEIVKLYQKHGWHLRRVLLTAELKNNLTNAPETIFGDAEIIESEMDGAWFSRVSNTEQTAWELRHLSASPFAMMEMIDNELGVEERQEVLEMIEDRLSEKVTKPPAKTAPTDYNKPNQTFWKPVK